jgi:hypothetical protein
LDAVNSEAVQEEYIKGGGRVLRFLWMTKDARRPCRLGFGGTFDGSYFPNALDEFRDAGLGMAAEVDYYAGDIAEQKDLWRLSWAPKGEYRWDWEREPPLSAGGPFGERLKTGSWRGYFPFTASYSFDGVRFEGKAAPSYLSTEARENFDVKYAVPLYVAFTASLDPKFVKGLPLPGGVDSQSAVAVNFTYELGRDPLRFERLGNKFSLGFEYAPAKK